MLELAACLSDRNVASVRNAPRLHRRELNPRQTEGGVGRHQQGVELSLGREGIARLRGQRLIEREGLAARTPQPGQVRAATQPETQIVSERPNKVGIDPYIKMIDRNPDDNLKTL